MGNSLKPGFFLWSNYTEWLEELAQSGLNYEAQPEGILLFEDDQTLLMQTAPILQHDLEYYPNQILARCRDPQSVLIIMMQAGHAALGIVEADELVASKIITKYMVRKSQGKAQYNYLEQKGKSRLGSRIRLQQSKEFFDQINDYLEQWLEDYDIATFFVSCSPRLKGAWFAHGKGPPIDKQDPRWRKISKSIHKPNLQELRQVHHFLSRARLIHYDQENTNPGE